MHARHRSFAKRYLVFLALGAVVSAGFVSRALAAWGTSPVVASSGAGAQTGPLLVNGSSGRTLLAWTDHRDTSGVYAQVVDSLGVAGVALQGNGVPVALPDTAAQGLGAVSDNAGGMLLAWSDLRVPATRGVWAQRVSAAGLPQWPAAGVHVSTGAGAQYEPAIVADGSGGAYVAWTDLRNGNADIYAQHLLADGTLAWGASGVAVCTFDSAQGQPQLVADRLGGVVVSWEDRRNGSATSTQVFLQRLLANGSPRFAANGISVDGTSSTTRGRMACEPNGTTVVMFADTIGSGPSYGLFAQRFDSTGSALYASGNRVTLSSNANPLWPVAVFARANGQAMFVYASPTEVRARAQSSSGADLWGGSNGIALSTPAPAAAYNVTAISDGADGAWVSWTDGEEVRLQRVASGGTLPIAPIALLVSPVNGHLSGAATSVLLSSGDVVVAWEDADAGAPTDTNIVAQRVSPTGLKGEFYRIVASSGPNGIIAPGPGTIYVQGHSDLQFRPVSSVGYHIESLTVDGTNMGPLPNWWFVNVTSHHTIASAFSNQLITQRTITAPDVFVPLSFPFAFSNDAPATVLASLYPPDATRWRFGRWDPTFKHYDVPPDSLTHLAPGQGYWFATKMADTLDTSGAANPEFDFTLALTPVHAESTGWNQIGQPFRFPVAVSSLMVRSGAGSWVDLVSQGQTYTGRQVFGWDPVNGYTVASTLTPGRSYWVHKELGANVSLLYPFEYTAAPAGASTPVPVPTAWAIRLDLTQPAAPAAHLQLGTAQGDGPARSYSRLPDSPGPAPAIWAAAAGAEWSALYGDDAQQLEWDVFVRGGGALSQASLAVSFDGVPEGREVTLSDPVAGWTRVLDGGENVTLALGGEPRRLVVRVASSGAVAPAGVATLRALAPNPFAESTALSFVLPVAGDLDAQVYDVGGRRVATLSRRGLSAGEHVIQWNGRDGSGVRVRPGVYLLRWSAGGRSGAARIVSLQ